MDEKKVVEEIAALSIEVHRETRGKKKPNVLVGPSELIDLMPGGPGMVINHNKFSINLRAPDIILVLR